MSEVNVPATLVKVKSEPSAGPYVRTNWLFASMGVWKPKNPCPTLKSGSVGQLRKAPKLIGSTVWGTPAFTVKSILCPGCEVGPPQAPVWTSVSAERNGAELTTNTLANTAKALSHFECMVRTLLRAA